MAIRGNPAPYDTIGKDYSRKRQADPRIATAVARAIDGCASLLNVGAGTGSYEPPSRNVIAVELSTTMIRQRSHDSAPAVQARAELLPFRDRSFDAVLAVLTLHHWDDQDAGIAECSRVARDRVVVLTIDPEVFGQFWLFEYLPQLRALDRHLFPNISHFAQAFESIEIIPVPIPADCRDGFLGAYWRRPTAYHDPLVRQCISSFAKLSTIDIDTGLARLKNDVESGAWASRYASSVDRDALDLGYRLLVCRPTMY